jgi:hypothetical protein
MSKTKSRKNRSKSKTFMRVTKKTLPIVAARLKKIGSHVKNITIKSRPGIEKGLGTVYNSVLTGFDYGVKRIKKGIHVIKNKSKTMRNSRRRRRH